ncbi:MAG: hypothetical protein JSS51_13135 [Planctomycetes bacterium]|nr:hypothetical protein [Planctomycetota bacterium]
MQRTAARLSRLAARTLLAVALAAAGTLAACASDSSSDSQWKGDDGGYGGTGKFNPVGAEAGSSDQFKSNKSSW